VSLSWRRAPADNRGIGVGFTDRAGGRSLAPYDSFNLGRQGLDDPDHLRDNFALLARTAGLRRLAIVSQVHGVDVAQVGPGFPLLRAGDPVTPAPVRADAMVTTRSGVGLVIRVADCLPVLLADPNAQVIAAAHAGRVGLLAGVLQATVAAMRQAGATAIQAWVGPHICPGCYEVGAEVANDAWQRLPATQSTSRTGRPAIDLGAGALAILEAEQVSVQASQLCTACQPQFFSHRRDQGATGRQAGLIWRQS
jgi:YfiH family protein